MPKTNTDRTKEVSEHINRQRLGMARLSRDAYTAKMEYQRLRMRELEMMRALVEDEYEETQASTRRCVRLVGFAVNCIVAEA